MPITIPKLIEVVVDQDGRGSAVRIDGVELTTAIADHVTISLPGRGGIKTLAVELYADDIRIVTAERSSDEPEHEHHPVQHRDGKEPWCGACGMNADGREPRRTMPMPGRPAKLPRPSVEPSKNPASSD